MRLLEFIDNRHMNLGRMLALYTGRLYTPGDTPSVRDRVNTMAIVETLLTPQTVFRRTKLQNM